MAQGDAMSESLDDQIKCVGREIALRKRVYPKLVGAGKMSKDTARDETRRMEAVLETLKEVKLEREAL